MNDPLKLRSDVSKPSLDGIVQLLRGLYTFTDGGTSIDVLLRIIGYPYLVTDHTVAAGGENSVNFTGGLGSDPAYLLLYSVAPETDGADLWLRMGAAGTYDSGASDYSWARSSVGSAGTSDSGDDADAQILVRAGVGSASGEHAAGFAVIQLPSSTVFYKPLVHVTHAMTTATAEIASYGTGTRRSTSAMTDIQILFSAGQVAQGSYAALYAFPGVE